MINTVTEHQNVEDDYQDLLAVIDDNA